MQYCHSLTEHYEGCWSQRGESCNWEKGPTHGLPNGFHVLRFAPRPRRSAWTYATVCMSQPGDRQPLELHLLSPVASDVHVELLTIIAHYHRTGEELGLGHSVNLGRPWLPGSSCTHGLVSLPYLDGPSLETCEVDGATVRFLWLVPITRDERDFKKKFGLEALEARFEQARFNYLDPDRTSVI
jgi:hypothetical protein